jgi:hypothetical protein
MNRYEIVKLLFFFFKVKHHFDFKFILIAVDSKTIDFIIE